LAKKSNEQRAYEKSIKFVVRFSNGRDIVEEFVATRVWPLDRNTYKEFTLDDVSLPLMVLRASCPVLVSTSRKSKAKATRT
jgi:hypothetical protein